MYWTDDRPDQTLGSALAGAVERYGDKEAYTFPGRRISFREADAESDSVARACLALGLKRGDRVGVLMASHPEWVALYFGLAKIGVSMVPLNTRFKASEIEFVLKKSGVKALFFRSSDMSGKDYAALLAEVVPELGASRPGELHSVALPALRTVVDLAERPAAGTVPYADFLAGASGTTRETLAAARRAVQPRDEALVQFTSGTTSFPKGAMLYHAGMLRGAAHSIRIMRVGERDAYFSVQPFYHSGGTLGTMLPPLISGCRVVTLVYFDTGDALEMMESERATVVVGHQPHYIEYLNHPSFPQRRLTLERMFIIAGPEIFRMVKERTGIDALVSGYGMTESHLYGTYTTLDDPEVLRFNTNGRAVAGVEVEIRDPDDGVTVLGPDEEGEIFLKVEHPMLGYLDEPELTREVLDEAGWYRSGDQGVLGANGYLRLLGRVRDMIRVGGENLAGAEVEACLLEHPAVKQAAAVPGPDPRLGEVVVAFVELKDGAPADVQGLIEHCKARLASFKVPRAVHFVTEWPMSGTGKIQKRLLLKSLS